MCLDSMYKGGFYLTLFIIQAIRLDESKVNKVYISGHPHIDNS